MSIAAANGAGDTLKVSLYRKVNSMMARIYHSATGEVCLHVWNPLQGTMGGLPVEKSAISTPSAVVDFLGYDAALSNPSPQAASGRRRAPLPPASVHQQNGRLGASTEPSLRAVAEGDSECPQDDDDCRYACVSAGFVSESFGGMVVLHPAYDGEACNCSRHAFTQTSLIGEVEEGVSSESVDFRFQDAFHGDFLPPTANLKQARSVQALLRPWDSTAMILDVGPGCAYRMGITVGILLDNSRDEVAKRAFLPQLQPEGGILDASAATRAGGSAATGTANATVEAGSGDLTAQTTNATAQVQFMAISGRVGGPKALPVATQELTRGLGWANGHFFSLFSDPTSSESNKSNTTRQRLDSGGGLQRLSSCQAAEQSEQELFSTMLTVVIALVISFFGRHAINGLIRILKKRRGQDCTNDRPALPFPCWELTIILIFFMGLSEAVGAAISSNCLRYEVAGGLMASVLLFFVGAVVLSVCFAVQTNVFVWKPSSVRESLTLLTDAWHSAKGKSCFKHTQNVLDALQDAVERGKWEVQPDNSNLKMIGKRFQDRFGITFIGVRGNCWWFGQWRLITTLAVALVVACVVDPSTNAGLVLAIKIVDSILLIVFRPNADYPMFIMDTYKAFVNLMTMTFVYTYILGFLSLEWFTQAFLFLSVLSIIPNMLSAIFNPCNFGVAKFRRSARKIIRMCCQIFKEAPAVERTGSAPDPNGSAFEQRASAAEGPGLGSVFVAGFCRTLRGTPDDPKQSADSSSAEGGDDAAKDGSPPASFHSVRASPFTGSFVMMHPSAASGYSASVSLAAPVFVYPPANLNPGQFDGAIPVQEQMPRRLHLDSHWQSFPNRA